jgi:hypothetical protein
MGLDRQTGKLNARDRFARRVISAVPTLAIGANNRAPNPAIAARFTDPAFLDALSNV